MKKSILIKIVISILLISFLFYKIGFLKIIETLTTFKIRYLFISLPLFFINQIVATINLKILSKPLNKKIKFFCLMRYQFKTHALGMISPGRIGEFFLAYLLKKHGFSIGQGTAILIFDRLITFFCLTLIMLFGFHLIFPEIKILLILLFVLAVVLSFLILVFSSKTRYLIRKYILRSYSKHFTGFSKYLKLMLLRKKALVFLNFLLTLIKWAIPASIAYLIFLGFGIKIPLIFIYSISAFVSLISLIPISINGIGVKEGASVFLYGQLGVAPQIVMSYHVVAYFLQYLFILLIFLFTKWVKD